MLNVQMMEKDNNLNEVVVVGYGTQAKKDITGSVAVVSSEALTETPVATFAEALQGKASGVYISSTGAPGSETTIRIRGVGSVNGSDPLIVVDGVSNVSIDAVNPNDIESLQVLKDASATAIYGAQGANGVIIITTKQGTKSGTVRVSYDGYVGGIPSSRFGQSA
jgi:TonB-dependent SusC/RagA subfamily outer membrane receptor